MNKNLKRQILHVIDEQIRNREPKFVCETYEKLQKMGYSSSNAKTLIGQAFATEMFMVMKHRVPYDEARYKSEIEDMLGRVGNGDAQAPEAEGGLEDGR